MANFYKTLGQAAPASTTLTTLYTVPSARSTVVSSLAVCNRGAVDGSYRIAVRPGGAAIDNRQYVAYDATLPAKATDTVTIGITLATGDVVSVYASNSDFSFNLFGVEIS